MHQILCEDASRPCRDDHMTKGRNWKLIPVTSSNEHLKHKCVDLSYYNRYLNQIWYRSQISHCLHAGMVKFTTSKYRCRLPLFWIFRLCKIKKNVSSSGLDEDICIKFYGIMHWTFAYTTACTVDHGLYGSTSCSYSLNYSKLQ